MEFAIFFKKKENSICEIGSLKIEMKISKIRKKIAENWKYFFVKLKN